MPLVPYKNTGKSMRFIGGQMIPPGETRMIDSLLIPIPGLDQPVLVSDVEPVAPVLDVEKILSSNLKQFADLLPALSLADLAVVESAEQAKTQPRRGALEAIASERICRAAAVVSAKDIDLDAYAKVLAAMSDAELAEQNVQGNSSLGAVIDAEIQRRDIAKFKNDMAQFEIADLQELKTTYADQPAHLEALDQLLAEKGA